MLAILQSVSSSGEVSGIELVISIGTVLAFIGGVLFIGSKTIPRFVNLIGKTNQHDVIVVAILGVALRHVWCAVFCLRWCTNGYYKTTNLYSTSHHTNLSIYRSKILYRVYSVKVTRL